MRKDEFVMRGQTASGETEVLNFSGYKPGYAYRLVEFQLYPKTPSNSESLFGTVTAGKTAVSPTTVDFNDDGLIATNITAHDTGSLDGAISYSIINDTFLITQNLILMVISQTTSEPVNWQCKFMPVKMSKSEEAVTNYRQFMISED